MVVEWEKQTIDGLRDRGLWLFDRPDTMALAKAINRYLADRPNASDYEIAREVCGSTDSPALLGVIERLTADFGRCHQAVPDAALVAEKVTVPGCEVTGPDGRLLKIVKTSAVVRRITHDPQEIDQFLVQPAIDRNVRYTAKTARAILATVKKVPGLAGSDWNRRYLSAIQTQLLESGDGHPQGR